MAEKPKILHKCCVGGCSSNNRTHRLFVFPRNDRFRDLWLSFVCPTNPSLIKLTKFQLFTRRVCEKHFDATQFDKFGNRIRYSYPCLFTEQEILLGIPRAGSGENITDHNYANHCVKQKAIKFTTEPSLEKVLTSGTKKDGHDPYSSAEEQEVIEATISEAGVVAEPESDRETEAEAETADEIAQEDEEEEEVWTLAEIMACEECGRAAEKDGKLFQCVECPRVLCAECERADRHRQHCMLRLPSRRIYDRIRTLFESIREAVTARLTEDDDYDPNLEPKDEPIDPDPLNTTFTEDPIQAPAESPSEVKPEDRKRIIVKARTLVPSNSEQVSVSVPVEKNVQKSITNPKYPVLVDKSEPIPSIVIEPKLQTVIKPKFVHTTRIVHESIKTVALETSVNRTVHEPKSVQILEAVTKSVPEKSVPLEKSVPVQKSIPITRTVPKPIPVPESNYVLKTEHILTPIPHLMDDLLKTKVDKTLPGSKSIPPVRTVPKPIPLPDTTDKAFVEDITVSEALSEEISVPQSDTEPVRTVPKPILLPAVKSVPKMVAKNIQKSVPTVSQENSLLKPVPVPKMVPQETSIPKGKSLREVLFEKVAILKRPRPHEHRYRQVSTAATSAAKEAVHETTRPTVDEDCEDTAKRKKTDDQVNEDDVFTEIEYLSETELTETTNEEEYW